ncbi:MAG: hypothetical protein ACXAEX_17775 [Promethearchaeota archaeon]|jgi:lysyl-tRNA synthetase class I
MIVILSYFHTRIGTVIFDAFPRSRLDEGMPNRLYDIMTQQNEEEFFTQAFEDLKLLNYYFQVPSDWARGYREMVMLSIVINQYISPEIEESISSLCKEFTEKMQSTEDIFTGFYMRELKDYDEKDKERIKKNETIIKGWVRDFYWEIIEETRKVSEEEIISSLLDDRYVFESLEKMSEELKTISKEINKSDENVRNNSDIKNAISSLNTIIDDLYEGFIEKMTILDIENQNGLLTTDDEMELDVQMRKKKLLQILQGEVSEEKE